MIMYGIYLTDLRGLIKAAEEKANMGSGGSDVHFTSRVQAAYSEILDRAPDVYKPITEAELRKRGFDLNLKAYEADEGDCDLTGIPEYWCPCGRHP